MGLLNDLIDRAAGGDPGAIDLLHAGLRSLPARRQAAERDRRVRDLAAWLLAVHPSLRPRRIAEIIEAASQKIRSGRDLDGAQFQILQPGERQILAACVEQIIEWAPALKWRHILSVIS